MEQELIAITYIGKTRTGVYETRHKGISYEFEWQKGVGIGGRRDEVPPMVALKLAKRKDRQGKRLFYLDRLNKEVSN